MTDSAIEIFLLLWRYAVCLVKRVAVNFIKVVFLEQANDAEKCICYRLRSIQGANLAPRQYVNPLATLHIKEYVLYQGLKFERKLIF